MSTQLILQGRLRVSRNRQVLALTAKRVKIEADDEDGVVIRCVPPESLQRRG